MPRKIPCINIYIFQPINRNKVERKVGQCFEPTKDKLSLNGGTGYRGMWESGNRNGERGTGNGERGTGNGESLKPGIFKMGNL